MMMATTIGLDIARQVFQVHGADKAGRTVLRQKLRRSEVAQFFSEYPSCLEGIEASGSALLGGCRQKFRDAINDRLKMSLAIRPR